MVAVIYNGPHSVIQPVSTLLLYRGVPTPIDWPDDQVSALLRKWPDVTLVEPEVAVEPEPPAADPNLEPEADGDVTVYPPRKRGKR